MEAIALLIDVGAEACRAAVLTAAGTERPVLAQYHEYAVADHDDVFAVIARFLTDAGLEKAPPVAGVAISGPAKAEILTVTQTGWSFTRQALCDAFGFSDVVVLNDNAATALSIAWLQPHDILRVGGDAAAPPPSTGRFAVVTPDMGLGVSAIETDETGYRLVDSEGGHAAFAPSNPAEARLAEQVGQALGRVSWERLLSWPGLARIHSCLAETEGRGAVDVHPLEVLLYGRTGADPLCAKALDTFFGLLGGFAGDIALTLCAVDGVFLSGRFVSEASELIGGSVFRQSFEAKGRLSPFVRAIPTYAVLNRGCILIGLARAVHDHQAATQAAKAKDVGAALLQGAADGLAVLDASLNLLCSNERYWTDAPVPGEMRQPGQPFAKALKAMADSGLLGEGQPQEIVDSLCRRLEAGQSVELDRHMFGGRIYHDCFMPTAAGVIVVTSSDVTQTRLRSRELETIAVTLRDSRDRAETANRAKSQFVATMSHEIRTPMNGVLGMAELLGRTSLSDAQKDMLDVIQSSGENLLAVINDILDVSAVEAGKLTLKPRPFDLCVLVEDVGALLDARARAKGLELAVRFRPGLPSGVVADRDRMRQVITNLVGNAVKFTDQGHVLIDVDGQESRDNCRYVISVTDTGPGIAADKLDAVFGMFEQIDMSTSRRFEGTGLGLNISRSIMDAMNGAISVESVLGEGSTFRIEIVLPLSQLDVHTPPHAVRLHGRRILIVDDRAVNRRILTERLNAWGMAVTAASGGQAALEILDAAAEAAQPFELCITDMQMPGMDGVALARAMRARPDTAKLPLVLLTSADLIEPEGLDLFEARLTKPARAAALEAAIRQVLAVVAEPAAESAEASEPPAHSGPDAWAGPPLELAETSTPKPDADDRRWRMLVAEDHPVNVKLVRAYLKDTIYDATFAADGAEAIDLYRSVRPDLVLMDLSMPNVDGFEATRRIRELEQGDDQRAPIPILALSANVIGDIHARCLEAGMTGHIGKPIKADDLVRTLSDYLTGDRRAA